jgi:hypothetical protein
VASFVSPHGKLRHFEKKGKQKKTRRLKKRKQKKHAEPKTRIGSVSCPVASSPDPNVRLKFEKPAGVRQFGTLTHRRSERVGGTVAAFAWRAERDTPMPRCGTTTLFRAKSSKRNPTDPTISEEA